MTDHPSTQSQSQPSMEDILASIRRIIDDEEQTPAAASPVPAPDSESRKSATVVTPDWPRPAEAASENDEAGADPEAETIFPQRQGRLWRRVAGHQLDDDEPDPLFDDDTFELTDVLDDDTLELDDLLESEPASDPEENRRLLDTAAAMEPKEEPSGSILPGAAAFGTAGAITASTMDRVTGRFAETEEKRDRVTASVAAEKPSEKPVASADDDLPPPVFERVDVAPSSGFTAEVGEEEGLLDTNFEGADPDGLSADYSDALHKDGDARERELDDRFYNADTLDEGPPEIDGSYAASLGGEPKSPRNEGAPNEDEMETVGGLVRDALRGRLPAVQKAPEGGGGLVSSGAEDSAARSLAALARYDAQAPRRIYGGIKITDADDSPTIEGMVQDTLRPMLRDWLNDNLPTLVENMVKQEVDRISARSRRFVRDDD